MVEITLQPWTEPLAGDVPAALAGRRWLWHQVETFRLLEGNALVVNTSPTGTGKTTAAHTHLIRSPMLTLIIAPTNALVAQHADDAERFVARHQLPHQVVIADAAALSARRLQIPDGQSFDNGRTLLSLLTGRLPDVNPGQPRVVITNPDIFVRAVCFDYGSQARNLAAELLGVLDYLVIDEVHYYDGLQLSALFFALALWGAGFAERPERRVLLLTATPDGDLSAALDALAQIGLVPALVDPATAPTHLERVTSLTPVHLRLECLADEVPSTWAKEAIAAVRAEEDGAVLLDRLDQVAALYAALRPDLGEAVRRITGPTPSADRRSASGAPLVLATPTVDIGFNFVGRAGKRRQPLDRVWFQAPTLDRFWQRLGRVGRVLSSDVRDVPSTAVAALPEEVLSRLSPPQQPIARPTLKALLEQAASGGMDRARLGEAAAPASADLLAYAWAGLAAAVTEPDRLRPFYERLPHPPSQTFSRALGRGRGLRELEDIRRGRRKLLDPYNRFGWLPWLRDEVERERCRRLPEIARDAAHPKRRKAAEQLERLVVCAGSCLDAARAFRGDDAVDADVSAWDELGLYLDRPGWVSLSLARLVRRHTFEVLADERAAAREAPPGIPVVLTGELPRPRRVSLVLEDCDRATYERRRGRVYGWDCVGLHVEREGAMEILDNRVAMALRKALEAQGVAVLFPFRPGAARELGCAHRLWPWTIWLGAPNRGEPLDGWVGSAAIRMEALLRHHQRGIQCQDE